MKDAIETCMNINITKIIGNDNFGIITGSSLSNKGMFGTPNADLIKGHKTRYHTKNNEQINLDTVEDNASLIDPESENVAIFNEKQIILFTNSKYYMVFKTY